MRLHLVREHPLALSTAAAVVTLAAVIALYWQVIVFYAAALLVARVCWHVLVPHRGGRRPARLRPWLETIFLGVIARNTLPAKRTRTKLRPVYDTRPRPGRLPRGY